MAAASSSDHVQPLADHVAGSRMSEGEVEARYGLFGERTLVHRYGDKYADEPSDCDDCYGPFPHVWVNWNYRVCYSCWWVASATIWKYFVYHFSERAANEIWSFLVGPGQYGGRPGARLPQSRVAWTRNAALTRAYFLFQPLAKPSAFSLWRSLDVS